MPEFSTEFWVASALAVLTLLLGLGVTLAMDAKTKGEFRFAVGCFIFSGLMITSTIGLWDVTTQAIMLKRILISGCIFAVMGVLVVEAVRWTRVRHLRASATEHPQGEAKENSMEMPPAQNYPASGTETMSDPVGSLARLGWEVKDIKEPVVAFVINTRPLPDVKESAAYFRLLHKPFRLQLQQVPSISGLRFLAGIRECVAIDISASDISDLSDLQPLKSLHRLNISQTPFTVRTDLDISPLASLVNLETLGLSMSRVKDVEPLRNMTKLMTLNIGTTLVKDISPLVGLTRLKSLEVRESRVTDVSGLSTLPLLKDISVDEKQIPSIAKLKQLETITIIAQVPVDITAVGSLPNLKTLFIWGTPLVDLSPLRTLHQLTSLRILGTGMLGRSSLVQDADAIGALTNLESLSLGGVQIDSLRFSVGLHRLNDLNLAGMPIASVAELANLISLRKITFVDLPVSDISPLLSLPNLAELMIMRTPARADVIAELERRGVKVTL